jgi:hypothetical protein
MSFATLNELKERLQITGKGVEDDDFLEDTLAQANSYIESIVGRPLTNQSHTEYCSGCGVEFLLLSHGPIQAIHSVTEISWSAVDTPSTQTTITDYLIHGNETWWKLPGMLQRISGSWYEGQLNYKVIYSAGFATVPDDLKNAELFASTFLYNKRKDAGQFTTNIGTGNENYRGELELKRDLMTYLAPYMPVPATTSVSVGVRRVG